MILLKALPSHGSLRTWLNHSMPKKKQFQFLIILCNYICLITKLYSLLTQDSSVKALEFMDFIQSDKGNIKITISTSCIFSYQMGRVSISLSNNLPSTKEIMILLFQQTDLSPLEFAHLRIIVWLQTCYIKYISKKSTLLIFA